MLTQLFSIGLLILLTAMLPGPDFALVTKNTILSSRRAGIFTAIGIASACLVHITYCMLGLAIIISQSLLLFNIIKYIGAAYLIYLGIISLLAKKTTANTAISSPFQKKKLTDLRAFWQGFLCNLLNPKATLFFLALFTVVVKPGTSSLWQIVIAVELITIILVWFFSLTILLSHPRVLRIFTKAEHSIEKILGVFLIGFGVALAFVKR